MATYKVTGPDGAVYKIDAPDDNALNEAVDQLFSEQGAAPAGSTGTNGADPMAPASYPQPGPTPPPEPPSFMDRAGKNLRVGAQAVGEGVANVAGFPVDAVTALAVNPTIWAKNKVFGGDTPFVSEPMGGSAGLKKGVRELADTFGGAVKPEEMKLNDRMIFEGIGGATGALAGGAALARRGIDRVGAIAKDKLPQIFDSAVKPYVDDAAKVLMRDAFGGAGAGAGIGATQSLPEEINLGPLNLGRAGGGGSVGVIADLIGSLAGGVGGMGALNFGRGTAQQAKTLAGAPFGKGLAKDVPMDPNDWRPYSNKSADMASEIYQGSATNPDKAPEFMRQNRAELEPVLGERLPTPGAMAEDPGLVALERQLAMEDRNPMIRRDQNLNAAVRDTVDTVAPAGADPAALQASAAAEAERLRATTRQQSEAAIGERQARVDTVEGRAGAVDTIRQQDAAALGPYQSQDAATNASRRLDSAIVDETYIPDRARKNELYSAVDPNRTEMVDIAPMADAAAKVRQQVNDLGPQGQQIPGEFMQRIERLAPKMETQESGVLGPDGAPLQKEVNVGGSGQAPVGDIVDLQKYTGAAREAARTSGNFDLADNIAALRKGATEATAGSPAADAANQNYRENFAPKYRPGPGDEMAKFTKEIDRDPTRSKTPPSQTAGRFLSSPEKVDALRRVLNDSPAGERGNAAVRDYLLSDLATSGVLDSKTGTIRPDKLRAWRNSYGSTLDAAPGFAGEVDGMIARAAKGERVSGGLADQVKAAQAKLKEAERAAGRSEKDVEDRINKGALGAVIDSDPDKAVSAIMSDGNKSARRLDELVALTKNDADARAGLKAAVRDYMIDKSTTTATEKLPAGDSRGPLSFAKTQKLFQEHEQQLAKVFSPEEMNSLRVVHKALEVQNLERVRVRSGSDTVEKLLDNNAEKFLATPMGQATEAVIRLKFGMLKGGGIVSIARRYAAGLTPEDGQRAHDLLKRAAFDPDLAMVLATRKIPPGSPAYNATIQRALAGGAAVREMVDEDPKPLEMTIKKRP